MCAARRDGFITKVIALGSSLAEEGGLNHALTPGMRLCLLQVSSDLLEALDRSGHCLAHFADFVCVFHQTQFTHRGCEFLVAEVDLFALGHIALELGQ